MHEHLLNAILFWHVASDYLICISHLGLPFHYLKPEFLMFARYYWFVFPCLSLIFPSFGRALLGKGGWRRVGQNNGVEAVIISEVGKKWNKI